MALRVARGLFRLWLVLSPTPQLRLSRDRLNLDPKDFAAWKVAQERRSAIWHAGLLAFLPPAFGIGARIGVGLGV